MNPLVGLIMGSTSDWSTLEHAANTLEALGVPHEVRVVSAHRTPDLLFEYAATPRGAVWRSSSPGPAGPRICRAWSPPKPCCRCWVSQCNRRRSTALDSLLSIVQMPGGIPVGALAIGKAGAVNAALLAAALLGNKYPAIREAVRAFRARQTAAGVEPARSAERPAMNVGIVGGGQLARMLALAGYPLGLRFQVLDPAADACAGQVATLIQGDYDDEDRLEPVGRVGRRGDFRFRECAGGRRSGVGTAGDGLSAGRGVGGRQGPAVRKNSVLGTGHPDPGVRHGR
jgi:5-(carboxyamino)imidazole ribonucleotide mutase